MIRERMKELAAVLLMLAALLATSVVLGGLKNVGGI
jgi:hypothetical protein